MKTRKKIVYVTEPPEGLVYLPDFLTDDDERVLLSHISLLPFEPYDHHGYKANREVVYFGQQGGYSTEDAAAPSGPIPDWLLTLRDRFAEVGNVAADDLVMALVARYKIGAKIGWHRDRPQFGPAVFGASLSSDAEMRFRRYIGEIEEMYKITLARRSAYIIGGAARSVWQHGMNPVKELRYSITFRTLRGRRAHNIL